MKRCDRKHWNLAQTCALVILAFASALPSAVAQVAQEPLVQGGTIAATDTSGAAVCRGSAVALTVSSPSVREGELVVRSGFVAGTWEGQVAAYEARAYMAFLQGATSEPVPAWTASVPPATERAIYTSASQGVPVAFEWCALSVEQRALLDPVYAGATACPTAPPPILEYLRGDARDEQRNGGQLRNRSATRLGDVVNSAPLFSRAADAAYQLAPAASYSAAGTQGHRVYRDYVQRKRASRVPIVIFGANDGMLHILDARTGEPAGGRELFAYVPRSTYPVLRSLADPAYVHAYTVDGPVVEGDVWNGTAWQTIVVGTTGAGAPGVFAIDVTTPGPSMDNRNVLWDITRDDHASTVVRNKLGRTIGAGVIGSVRADPDGSSATEPNGLWAYVVGNGYESRDGLAALLVFNARDGSLVRAIDTGVGGASSPNGLGAVAPVYDGNRNIIAVYAGDRIGNLWKFDLRSPNPSNWRVFNERPSGTAAPLFVASQPGATRPIHQAPRITPHPLGGLYVLFGTGRLFEIGDLADTADQGVFAVWDRGQVAPIAFDELAALGTEEYSKGAETLRRVRADDLARFDWNDSGFWVRFRPGSTASSGERVVAPLILDGGTLVVSTFSPDGATTGCGPGGVSHLYRIDLAGGFQQGGFGGEGGSAIGRRVEPTMGGYVPLHQPAEPGNAVRSLSASELQALLARSAAPLEDTFPVPASAGGCLHAGLTIDGSAAMVATNCAGLLPLRAWRPMK